MQCLAIKLPGGVAILCGRFPRRKACSVCHKHVGDKLCDGERAMGRGRTCDAPLCACCAVTRPDPKHPGDTLDFCPRHASQAPCSCSNVEDEHYTPGTRCCACRTFYAPQPIGSPQVCPKCHHMRAPAPEQLALGGVHG